MRGKLLTVSENRGLIMADNILNEAVTAAKKGLGWKTILTTFVTVTVIQVATSAAKRGTFGKKVSEISGKYL